MNGAHIGGKGQGILYLSARCCFDIGELSMNGAIVVLSDEGRSDRAGIAQDLS